MNNVTFTGSYSKIVKNPGKIFNRANFDKNNYLSQDFQAADFPLSWLATKLGDEDTVTLMSEENDLKLLVNSADKKFDINLGLEEGLYTRVYKACLSVMDTLKIEY